MASLERAYPLLMTTSSLIQLDALDLRWALLTIAELQDLRTERGIQTEVSLRQAITANMISEDELYDVVLRGGTDKQRD